MCDVLFVVYIPQCFFKQMQKEKEVVMGSCTELSKLILGLNHIWVNSSDALNALAKQEYPPSLSKTRGKRSGT